MMLKKVTLTIVLILTISSLTLAQAAGGPAKGTTAPPAKTETTQNGTKTKTSASMSMLDTFKALLDGIRAANAKVVSDIYWNSPDLVIFNSNGTVTKGWEQMSKNRTSSYAKLKDVVLTEREVHARLIGGDYGAVDFLWTQSQTSDGVPDSASGRTTLIFRNIGNSWKIIHAHISPEAPDPSRVLQSEQPAASVPADSPKPNGTP